MANGDWFPDSQWKEINRENMEKYGTTDYDEIDRMEAYTAKQVEAEADSRVQALFEQMLPEIQQTAHEDAIKQIRAEDLILDGFNVANLSSLISDTVTINGKKLDKSFFISERATNDPIDEDVRLYFDDLNYRWLVTVKDGKPKIVSRFVVVACLIVDANDSGECRAFVVFLKGVSKPLIFWGGIIDSANFRRQTQFQKKGLSNTRQDLYLESFIRALSMCKKVNFLTLPKHAGWNWTPSGSRVFVDSAMMKPQFEGLFFNDDSKDKKKNDNQNKMHNVFLDITLVTSHREFGEVVADYHSLLPDILPVNVGTVISAMSRLLPHYKEAELVQDRPWVFETPDDDTARSMMIVMHNRNHQSTKALFSSERITHIEEELRKYVDCVAIFRHSCSICSKHDFEKILKKLYKLLQTKYLDDNINRFIPVLLMDNIGIIPEEFCIHQLSLTDSLEFDDIEKVQKLMGEIHFHIVKFAERNPDAVKQRIKESIVEAKEMVKNLPYKSQSSSAIMFLSTAILLREGDVLTDADVSNILQWLRTEARSRTSMSHHIAQEIGTLLSVTICNGRLSIANQFGPPLWTPDKALVASDDSINVSKDYFNGELVNNVSVGRNKALQYLKEEDFLFTNKGEEQKTWTVQNEEGKKFPKRFYSLSRDLLTPEANRIVDEAIASDLFHKLDKPIVNFLPFIKHPYLDMVAGQVIMNYKHGTPFIAVTGAPGSGKSDWCMIDAVKRAKAGDVVIVLEPTNAFCRDEISAHMIPDEIINEHFEFWDLTSQGWPINIMDFSDCQNIEQQIQKLSSLPISGMHLTGSNQKFILVNKVAEWLERGSFNNISDLAFLPIIFDKKPDEKKLSGRLRALFSTVNMHQDASLTWAERFSSKGKIWVISSGSANINNHTNPFDVILDSLYSYKDTHRDDRLTIIADEFQTP